MSQTLSWLYLFKHVTSVRLPLIARNFWLATVRAGAARSGWAEIHDNRRWHFIANLVSPSSISLHLMVHMGLWTRACGRWLIRGRRIGGIARRTRSLSRTNSRWPSGSKWVSAERQARLRLRIRGLPRRNIIVTFGGRSLGKARRFTVVRTSNPNDYFLRNFEF